MVFASCKITVSPTVKFFLVFVHFFLSWSDCKNSFLQPLQNSFTMCYWTHLHLLWLYKSGLKNQVLKVARLSLISWLKDLMDTGKQLVRLLLLSVVRGLEFKIPSVSVIIVASASSSRDLPMYLHQRIQDGMGWTVLMFSNTHMAGIRRVPFPSNPITNACIKNWTFSLSISSNNALLNLFSEPVKLLPLSEKIMVHSLF